VELGICGQRCDDAESLGCVVQGEADHQHRGQCDGIAGCGLANSQTFSEIVQTDADRDQQGQSPGSRPASNPSRCCRFARGHGSRPVGTGPALHVAVVTDQPEQSDRQATGEQGAVSPHRPQVAGAVMDSAERGIDRFPGRSQYVPEQEHQHADCRRIQQHCEPWGGPA
jgi:hypothetical protein